MPLSRRALAAAAVIAVVLPLSACGSGDDTGGSSDASGKVEGDITFQTWNLRANFKSYFEGVIAGFEKKYPDAHVKWVDQPAENYADKISADAAGGTCPMSSTSPPTSSPRSPRPVSRSTWTSPRRSTRRSTCPAPGPATRYRG